MAISAADLKLAEIVAPLSNEDVVMFVFTRPWDMRSIARALVQAAQELSLSKEPP